MSLGVALAAMTLAGAALPEEEIAPSASVEVVRDGARWTADFRFHRMAPVWAFARSAPARITQKSWRAASWTIETPGVRLERLGQYDVLVAEKGGPIPEQVRVRFEPFSGDILTGYDAALTFTDGSVALFDQQFKAFPVESIAAAAALPIDLDEVRAAGPPTRTTFRDTNGDVLNAGERRTSLTLDDAGTYVLFGPAPPIVTAGISAIVDPGLPEWLRSFLSESVPEILASYARTLGPAAGGKPTVIVSWQGPTAELTSMGGSVLPNLVTMTFEGEGVLAESPAVRNQARWFVAHESAHFWLGQTVRYQYSREAWLIEGGADLLAVRTVAATDTAFDGGPFLQQALDDCVGLTDGRGIETAQQRGEDRTAYACGAILSLVAERVSGGSFSAWLRSLIEENREDGILTRAEWLAALRRAGGSAVLEAQIVRMLGEGGTRSDWSDLLNQADVRHEADAGGELRLL